MRYNILTNISPKGGMSDQLHFCTKKINKYNINFYKILDRWGQMRYFNIADSETIAVYGIKVSM